MAARPDTPVADDDETRTTFTAVSASTAARVHRFQLGDRCGGRARQEQQGSRRGAADDHGGDGERRIDFAHVDDVDAAYILDTCAEGGPVFLTATDVANPSDPRLLSMDLVDPMPAYPWSLIWRADEADKRILAAIRTLRTLSDTHGWCPADAAGRWP